MPMMWSLTHPTHRRRRAVRPREAQARRQRPENEQVIVLGPANHGQNRRRGKHRDQAPIVDRTERRMPTTALRAQHRDGTGDHANQAHKDMQPHDGEEDRRRGGYRYSRYDSRSVGGHGCTTSSREYGRGIAATPSASAPAMAPRKIT